jgi:hypothetical protein
MSACDFSCTPPEDGVLVTETCVGMGIYTYKQLRAYFGLLETSRNLFTYAAIFHFGSPGFCVQVGD